MTCRVKSAAFLESSKDRDVSQAPTVSGIDWEPKNVQCLELIIHGREISTVKISLGVIPVKVRILWRRDRLVLFAHHKLLKEVSRGSWPSHIAICEHILPGEQMARQKVILDYFKEGGRSASVHSEWGLRFQRVSGSVSSQNFNADVVVRRTKRVTLHSLVW